MKAGVQQARKVRREASPEEAAFLELLRTTDQLSRRLVPLLKAEELSPTQYNVLRILRGALEGLPCGEIGQRMITRDPDITRLLDRLKKRGLIARWRDVKDRRMVLVVDHLNPRFLNFERKIYKETSVIFCAVGTEFSSFIHLL